MKRLAVLAVLASVVAVLSAGAHAAGDSITLRARIHQGAWQRSLSIKFQRYQLKPFSLCAVFDAKSTRFSCADGAGTSLPKGTTLRLEQSPVGKALKRSDSPGWGMLAQGVEPSLGAVLSNTETGNKIEVVRYRVTLRDAKGKVLVTSNIFRVNWHK
jgi:hypothetical protein